jgi:shikimate kinase
MSSPPENKPNIYFLGFMGCGKSKIGSLLSGRIGFPFIDTDFRIVEESGLTINQIFDREGEPGFRLREKRLIESISILGGQVVSLGGGTVMDPGNWERISGSGITLALSYPAEIIARRLAHKKDRPLIKDYQGRERIERIDSLMKIRDPYYRRADLFLHFNREAEPGRVADILMAYLKGKI